MYVKLLIASCHLAWDTSGLSYLFNFFLSGSRDRWPGYLGPSSWSPQGLTLSQLSPEALSCCLCGSSRTCRWFPADFNTASYTTTYFRHGLKLCAKLNLISGTLAYFLFFSPWQFVSVSVFPPESKFMFSPCSWNSLKGFLVLLTTMFRNIRSRDRRRSWTLKCKNVQ